MAEEKYGSSSSDTSNDKAKSSTKSSICSPSSSESDKDKSDGPVPVGQIQKSAPAAYCSKGKKYDGDLALKEFLMKLLASKGV